MTDKLIYKKMPAIMRQIGAIGKDQKNTAQNFKFRGIDQFVNALYPALCEHGVFITPKVIARDERLIDVERSGGRKGVDTRVWLTMEYTFNAEDGSSVSLQTVGEGLDSGDKATNKAMSAALKYALIQAFCIPTEDMAEADRESPEVVTVSPKQENVPSINSFAANKPKPIAPTVTSGMPSGWR